MDDQSKTSPLARALLTLWIILTLVSTAAASWPPHQGVSATASQFGNSVVVSYSVFDPCFGIPFAGSAGSRIQFATPVVPVVEDGVVIWTELTGSANGSHTVYYSVYDPARTWRLENGGSRPQFNPPLRPVSDSGVVAWSELTGSANGQTTVYYSAYNPKIGIWAEANGGSRTINSLRVPPITQGGVVAWVESSGAFDTVYYRVFDPGRGQWIGQQIPSSGGSVFNLQVANGVVSWVSGGFQNFRAYNQPAGAWLPSAVAATHADCAPSKTFGPPPLCVTFTDMSIGGTSWSWDFDDNDITSTTRSPTHTFTSVGLFNVTQTVTGPGGTTTKTIAVKTDTVAPTGTLVINNGDEFTSSTEVTLTLNATDNGAVTEMRFSNNGGVFTDWEPYATNKAWTLLDINGQRPVFAQFRDSAENISNITGDSIMLDTSAQPVASFSNTSITVTEGAPNTTVTVNLSVSSVRTVTVDYATADDTATAGADYTATSGTLSFAPGTTSRSFTIDLADDSIQETDETISIQLSNPVNATIGGGATITLNDNDLPALSWTTAAISANESDGMLTATAVLNPAPVQTVTVRARTFAASATETDDFTPVDTTITFAPGETQQTVSVPIVNDVIVESSETLALSMSSPTNAILSAPSAVTLTILDNSLPEILFPTNKFILGEGITNAIIEMTLSKPPIATVIVDYFTVNESAIAPGDFTAQGDILVFTVGQTNATITIPIIDDLLAETNETALVRLANPINAIIGPLIETSLTIVDNDNQPTLSAPSVDSQGRFMMAVNGQPFQRYGVQFTQDFSNWFLIGSLTNVTGTVNYLDENSSNTTHRAYRVFVQEDN